MLQSAKQWLRDRLMNQLARRIPIQDQVMLDYLLPLVKHFESFAPNWYLCSSGVRTIGYGYTGSGSGLMAAPWTEEYAARVLAVQLETDYEPATVRALSLCGLTYAAFEEYQQAAIVSLCYNAGPGAIYQSSGRPATWAQRLKDGADPSAIMEAFYRWNKSGGRISPGLVRRRFTEMNLFYSGVLNFDVPGWHDYYIRNGGNL
jgi:lysozyme